MIGKKQRQSSRSYNDRERQAAVRNHFGRAPQIYTKDLHEDHKSFLNAIVNLFMKFGHRKVV